MQQFAANLPEDPYSQESDCERLISRIEKIGQEPTFATQDAVAAGQEAVGQLGQIGQYPLLAKLAEGGMGAVYLARDILLGRKVAIKFLLKLSPGLTERFLAEARVTARCSDENIVIIPVNTEI